MTEKPHFPFKKLEGVPPAQVRITELRTEPYDDRRRVKVFLKCTPFSEPPNVHLELSASDGLILAQTDIIETAEVAFVLTMHLREPTAESELYLTGQVIYETHGVVDQQTIAFNLPE